MTPEQALNLLVEATRLVPATRDQHQAILAALEVLKTLVEQKSQE